MSTVFRPQNDLTLTQVTVLGFFHSRTAYQARHGFPVSVRRRATEVVIITVLVLFSIVCRAYFTAVRPLYTRALMATGEHCWWTFVNQWQLISHHFQKKTCSCAVFNSVPLSAEDDEGAQKKENHATLFFSFHNRKWLIFFQGCCTCITDWSPCFSPWIPISGRLCSVSNEWLPWILSLLCD